MYADVPTIVIESNNPDLMTGIVVIVCSVLILTDLLGIKMKLNRKVELEAVKRKIIHRHDIIKYEHARKGKKANATTHSSLNF